MKQELLREYFTRSEFTMTQAEALAAIMSEFREEVATKDDIAILRAELRGEFRSEIASLKADLTWRFLVLLTFFSTAMTLFDRFVR